MAQESDKVKPVPGVAIDEDLAQEIADSVTDWLEENVKTPVSLATLSGRWYVEEAVLAALGFEPDDASGGES